MSSVTEADCAGATDVARTQDAPVARPPPENTSAVDWIVAAGPHTQFENAVNLSHHVANTHFQLSSQNRWNQVLHLGTHKSAEATTPSPTESATLASTGGYLVGIILIFVFLCINTASR